DDRIQRLSHLSDSSQDGGRVGERGFEFDDGGENLLVEDVCPNLTSPGVGHQARDRIAFLEFDPHPGERRGHLLNLPEANADRGSAEFDREAGVIRADAVGDIVGLDLFGAAPMDARALVRNDRVRERAAQDAWPDQLLFGDSRRGADVRFGIESPSQPASDLSNRPNHRRVEMLGAHPAEAGEHSTHSSWLTVARFVLGSMWIAPIGQTATQFPQATHFLGSIVIAYSSKKRGQTGLFSDVEGGNIAARD